MSRWTDFINNLYNENELLYKGSMLKYDELLSRKYKKTLSDINDKINKSNINTGHDTQQVVKLKDYINIDPSLLEQSRLRMICDFNNIKWSYDIRELRDHFQNCIDEPYFKLINTECGNGEFSAFLNKQIPKILNTSDNYTIKDNNFFDNCNYFTFKPRDGFKEYEQLVQDKAIIIKLEKINSPKLQKRKKNNYNPELTKNVQFLRARLSMRPKDIVLIINEDKKTADVAVITNGLRYDDPSTPDVDNSINIEFLKNGVEFEFINQIQDTITQIKDKKNIESIKSKIFDLRVEYNEIIDNIYLNNNLKFACKDFEEVTVEDEIEYLNDYKQVIIDGAPGTGKSYGVQKEIDEDGIIHERVTFYSDYEYHNFIGSIQPRLNEDNVLEYKFIKGPFTKLLDQALSNLEEKHYLVIEELTRGNAAAIFGDVFQLLDRDDDGFSCYPITNHDILENLCEESAAYLEYKFGSKIVLPPNFSIICTINSSDQNVFPLDTAFKRRFDYKIESTKPHENFVDFKFSIGKIADIEWSKFYQLLNEYILKDLNLKEDKQVGPYFIKDPKNDGQAVKSIQTKLAMYMWNDLHKVYTGSNKAIFSNVYTLADVSELFKTGTREQILDILTEDFKKHFSLTEEPNEE